MRNRLKVIRIFAAKFSSNTPLVGRLRRARGFTLIELMITIVIASILLAIGVPSMRNMIHQNRLSGSVNEFVAADHAGAFGSDQARQPGDALSQRQCRIRL